jgi:hypothetical protein
MKEFRLWSFLSTVPLRQITGSGQAKVSAISLSEGVVGRENEGIPDSHSRTL